MPRVPISVNHLRGLLKKQKGRCAISNQKMSPEMVTADHIIPVSRNPKTLHNQQNVWLVHKDVNTMKGALDYEELIKICKMILSNEKISRNILDVIKKKNIKPMTLSEYKDYINENFDEKSEEIKN
tara:strand:+ start:287 stop:664 length:378 start_codon:yes stop_codon:yes gene_type:complete